jgi:hypothetical protein
MPTISFQKDIAPLFVQFRGSMLWRLDLTNYEDMKANADLIYTMIAPSGGSPAAMPPAPYSPLPDAQIQLFKDWIAQGCPE